VTPVYKGGSPTSVNSYRPISVVSVFSQILERLVEKRLYIFAETEILPEQQFGFRKRHNTTHAALCLVDSVLNWKESGKACGIAFIDLRNAFPSADHGLILKKLYHYGVHGSLLNWFAAYLADRTLVVHVDGTLSPTAKITRGVPQGSVLVLFCFRYIMLTL
jgi:hypothetical protein